MNYNYNGEKSMEECIENLRKKMDLKSGGEKV